MAYPRTLLSFWASCILFTFSPYFKPFSIFLTTPIHFKQLLTVALKKLGKGSFSAPAAWQPVVLLNTLWNVPETIVACWITALS
jgi:hypothetical protein